MAEIQLIVQADDFGMCHAVNEGVARAFVDGVVTQAAIMAPCPWFAEAAALAREHAIPIGLHGTLTCEWDHLRWRPLTRGASLVRDDGTMHRTIEDAMAALAGPELSSIARPDADNIHWAERYRASDLAVLTDPEVRAAIEARGIDLVSAKDVCSA